jgi:dihydropteroate synthase
MSYPDGPPKSLNDVPKEKEVNIITTVKNFLSERITACIDAGIKPENILIDPGIGHGNFGKNLKQNLQLLAHLAEFKTFGLPILVGVSRKTFIGELLQVSSEERLFGSIAGAIIAAERGASFIRAHDVKATVQAIQVMTAILSEAK